MPSHYANYIKEREGREILEDKHGFASYAFTPDAVYIQEIYVLPDYRKDGVAARYADIIAEIARAKGFTKMIGSVCPSANGSTESLKVLLAYGFKVHSSEQNLIWFVKQI